MVAAQFSGPWGSKAGSWAASEPSPVQKARKAKQARVVFMGVSDRNWATPERPLQEPVVAHELALPTLSRVTPTTRDINAR